jgi:hypothetical protein
VSRSRLANDETYLDEYARRAAAAKGKTVYKGDECNITGHGRRRYVETTGCVVCSDARKRAKAKNLGRAPRGLSSTPEYRMWMAARNRAEAKGLAFTIEISDIVIPELCPVFGTPMSNPSLDRFDNTRGYTPDNIRVISRRANTIKSDATRDEILAIARYMLDEDDFEALLK